MEWLNYHHLLYFWSAAREGSVTRASADLRLAQSTVSTQIRQLEDVLGEQLFRREGRRLILTDVGRTVYQYAEEIFGLGREMMDAVKNRPTGRPLRFVVGVADQLPKLVAYRLLEPALAIEGSVRLVCVEGKSEDLFSELAAHRLDVVLTDRPVGPTTSIRAFNHLLGECGVTIFGRSDMARKARRRFPTSLRGLPFLMPSVATTLRRALEDWFEKHDAHPLIVGEFEDSALMKVFGQSGAGFFPGPTAIEHEICKQYGVQVAGRIDASSVKETFYAVSVERRLKHPAVIAISDAAREHIFR